MRLVAIGWKQRSLIGKCVLYLGCRHKDPISNACRGMKRRKQGDDDSPMQDDSNALSAVSWWLLVRDWHGDDYRKLCFSVVACFFQAPVVISMCCKCHSVGNGVMYPLTDELAGLVECVKTRSYHQVSDHCVRRARDLLKVCLIGCGAHFCTNTYESLLYYLCDNPTSTLFYCLPSRARSEKVVLKLQRLTGQQLCRETGRSSRTRLSRNISRASVSPSAGCVISYNGCSSLFRHRLRRSCNERREMR